MSFNYHVTLSDPGNAGGAADAVLVEDLDQALAVWSGYVSGQGTLEVALDIVQTAGGREDGGPTAEIQSGTTAAGMALYEPSSLYELRTGHHVPGSTSDITIEVSPGYLGAFDLAPGLDATSPASPGTYNPIVPFLHEIMHGFGMSGYYDSSGTLPGAYESTFDQFIEKDASGAAFFTGPHAVAANGGPVQLTTDGGPENYYHVGNTQSDLYRTAGSVTDPLTLDLMNGVVLFYDHPYTISTLDLAVLQDLGAAVNGRSLSVASRDTGDGSHVITGTAAGQTLQSLGTDVMTGGAGAQTFRFTPHFGRDEITDFRPEGPGHDRIDLSQTHFHDLGAVLRHTAMSEGSATIHLNPVDSITLDGITKARLAHSPDAFTFA